MATATPSPPPPAASHEEEDNHNNQQPPSPQESVRSPPSPIDDVDQHQQFANSNSPYSPRTSIGEPEKSVDHEHPPPEDVEDEQEQEPEPEPVPASPSPHDKIHDLQPSSAPPSPSSILQPSPPPTPPPTQPPTEPEHLPENHSPGHESPNFKQSPSPPPRAEDPVESPNSRESPDPNPNPNSDHESPPPYSPTTVQEIPSLKPHESPKDPSPSPPPTAASPSSPPVEAQRPQPLTTWSPNKPLVLPWTHQETANLIQAYQEKWYSLKKGPLKASQWEEVAITVAARCGYDDPTKTAKQCRHKIEKLRKRYRTERGKPRSKANAWNFFKLMDNLEKGPLPISSSPMALVEYQKPSNSNPKKRKIINNSNDDDDGEFLINKRSRSKSANHHISNGGLSRDLRLSDGGHNRVMRGLRTPVVQKRKGFYQEEEEEDDDINDEEDEGNEEEEGVEAQLAAEIKGFAEKFLKLENKKIEMIRDVERYRLEMENKRMEMILESQQMLVETVNKAFSRSSLKPHKFSAN